MKRLIPFLIAALSLSSCLKEDTWCPVMYVSFKMEDEFLEGDYDSRITNDVLLYIFKDDKLASARAIPYESIAQGAEYAIEKTRELTGNLKLVAWAVKSGEKQVGSNDPLAIHDLNRHPEYAMGDNYEALRLSHSPLTRAEGDGNQYLPTHHERYLGTLDPTEELWERDSHHNIILSPAPGRVIVNITDPGNYLNGTTGDAHIVVGGAMSQMNLKRRGIGSKINVRTGLGETSAETRAATGATHTTEIFGVLPSQSGQTLSVDIMNGTQKLQTLVVHTDDNLHQAISSGELLEFDYVLNSSMFTITVGPWTKKITIVNM